MVPFGQIQAWEAHTDYIRYLEVHPTLPYVLSASDDMSVKLWDWERQWDCTQVCHEIEFRFDAYLRVHR